MKSLVDFCKRNKLELAELPGGLFQVISPDGEIHSLMETELKRLGVAFLAKGRHNGREIITVIEKEAKKR